MAAQYFGDAMRCDAMRCDAMRCDADDDDSIGLTEQLMLGTGVFSGLYNEEPIFTTTTTNTTRTAGTYY